MAITGGDQTLIDLDTGILLAPESTVVVPEVQGSLAYDILYDHDSAIEYGEAQGLELNDPDTEGIPVNELYDEPRGYLAIDIESGYVADASNLVIIDYDDELSDEELEERAQSEGRIPVAPENVRDIEGLPFESVEE